MGQKATNKPIVHVDLGEARAQLNAASTDLTSKRMKVGSTNDNGGAVGNLTKQSENGVVGGISNPQIQPKSTPGVKRGATTSKGYRG